MRLPFRPINIEIRRSMNAEWDIIDDIEEKIIDLVMAYKKNE